MFRDPFLSSTLDRKWKGEGEFATDNELLLLLLLTLYLFRIPTSPKCFSVGSCYSMLHNFKFMHALITASYRKTTM